MIFLRWWGKFRWGWGIGLSFQNGRLHENIPYVKSSVCMWEKIYKWISYKQMICPQVSLDFQFKIPVLLLKSFFF